MTCLYFSYMFRRTVQEISILDSRRPLLDYNTKKQQQKIRSLTQKNQLFPPLMRSGVELH